VKDMVKTHCIRFDEILNHRQINLEYQRSAAIGYTWAEASDRLIPFFLLCLRVGRLQKTQLGQPGAE